MIYDETLKHKKDAVVVEDLKAGLMFDKALANGFYKLLKKYEQGVYIMSFDMKKNLPIYSNVQNRCRTIPGNVLV